MFFGGKKLFTKPFRRQTKLELLALSSLVSWGTSETVTNVDARCGAAERAGAFFEENLGNASEEIEQVRGRGNEGFSSRQGLS